MALSKEQRFFIIRRLAQFDGQTDVFPAFDLRWPGSRLSLVDYLSCDPARGILTDEELAVFAAVRASFLASPYAAPTRAKDVRLVELHRLYVKERDRGAVGAAAGLLAQIALESGDGDDKGSAGIGAVKEVRWLIVDPAKADANA